MRTGKEIGEPLFSASSCVIARYINMLLYTFKNYVYNIKRLMRCRNAHWAIDSREI